MRKLFYYCDRCGEQHPKEELYTFALEPRMYKTFGPDPEYLDICEVCRGQILTFVKCYNKGSN